MIADTAPSLLDQLTEAKEVELAFRAQAAGIVKRYNAEANRDPYSDLAEALLKRRKEALSQWKAARRRVEELDQRWRWLAPAARRDAEAGRRG